MRLRKVLTPVVSLCLISLLTGMAAAQNPLVYVSFLTGLTTGGTDIYEITPSGAQLLGTLDHGGGGPVAVDAQQNVYVVDANLDSNLFQTTSPVYMYAPGSTQGQLLFNAPKFGAEAMTVAADGTIYIAGQVPETTSFAVVKFAPPGYSPQVLRRGQNPRFPTGISVDSSGNLFVGWLDSFRTAPIDACAGGCILELPAGQTTWRTRLPDLAANAMGAGPVATSDGSLIFWTDSPGRFNYIETVPSGAKYPSQVIPFSTALLAAGNLSLAFSAGGDELWITSTGLSGFIGTNVFGINYPSGTVATTFPVNDPPDLVFITGIAVSPAYVP